MSKPKKIKLKPIPTIIRRLYKLASEKCIAKAGNKCEICGMERGAIYEKTGKPQRLEAHHVMSRNNKNSPLKFDLRNLCCVDTFHHKTGKRSAHRHGLWFAKWFIEHRPEDAQYIIDNTDIMVDLKDRQILEYIEQCLREDKPLNFTPEQLLKEEEKVK